MTVALDLDTGNAEANKADRCAEDMLVGIALPQGPTDPSKPAKLFWNATGASLSNDFKEIANELSNLRIVG